MKPGYWKEILHIIRKRWRRALGLALPLLLLPLPLYYQTGVAKCSYIIILTVSFWIVEPVGVPVTALIPLLLFPMMGILNTSDACMAMMKDPVANYMGCFAVGIAIEQSGLHERLALSILLKIGTSIRRLTLGCMVVTMLISMWLNNVAATVAMIPIVETILRELKFTDDPAETKTGKDITIKLIPTKEEENAVKRGVVVRSNLKGHKARVKLAMLLSITYGASFGGMATLNGCGPNFAFKGAMDKFYPSHDEPTYATWMFCHIPTAIICVAVSSLFLQMIYLGFGFLKSSDVQIEHSAEKVLRAKYKQMGNISFREGAVSFLFFFLIIVWFFRDPKFIRGWGSRTNYEIKIDDATPSLGVALLLFLIPSDPKNFWTSPALLDWKTFQMRIPWGLLMLVGSGFVFAEGAQKSGFSAYVAEFVSSFTHLSHGSLVFSICLLSSGLSQFMNNTVVASLLLPVLSELAQLKHLNPLLLMIPATIGSSFAFMFPVSQPSNAFIFQRGQLRTYEMMYPGFAVNILGCCVEVFIFNTLGFYIFDLKNLPWWLTSTSISDTNFNITATRNLTSNIDVRLHYNNKTLVL